MSIEQAQKYHLQNAKGDVYDELQQRTKSTTEFTSKESIGHDRRQKQLQKLKDIRRECELQDENAEIIDIDLPFRTVSERSSLTDLNNLMQQCPEPQPPITNKDLKTLQLNETQALIMAEQVRKMKTGMDRLQAIIKKFNCTERFKRDVDFIINNVGPAIRRAEQSRQKK